MVCTGAKSEEDSRKASRKYAKIIRSLGFPVEFKEFTVQNIVGSCDFKFQISLSKLNIYLGKSDFFGIFFNKKIEKRLEKLIKVLILEIIKIKNIFFIMSQKYFLT